MRLVLFDIDGTLIRINGAGKEALVSALEQVFGTSGPSQSYSLAGKTDALIAHDLLTAAGITAAEVEAGLPDVYLRMADIGRISFAARSLSPCQGVPELLASLSSQTNLVLGLLTGNNQYTAPLKLAAAGIDPGLFSVGAYGSDARHRNDLLPVAWARAHHRHGVIFAGARTIVVGDTPADILCARDNGAVSVAVATGLHSRASLAVYQPDHLLHDLADTERVIETLLATGDGK